MGIIDLKLIEDYIQSKRISKKKINSLEDDVEYMMLTMIKTNDPKMYRFCSEKVKQDYNFVKFYVTRFKDNFDLIDAAAKYYIDNSKDFINIFELNIIMMGICSETEQNNFHYGLSSLCRFIVLDAYHTSIASKVNVEGEVLNKLYGLGFQDVLDRFSRSEIIVNFLARNKISKIMLQYSKKFEIELHNYFASKEEYKNACLNHLELKNQIKEEIQNPFCKRDEIIGYDLYKIMIDFVSKYDSALGLYVQSRLDLLEPVEMYLSNAYLNWQMYNTKLEKVQFKSIIKMYEENYERFEYEKMFSKYDMLQFAAKKLGIDNIFNEYLDPEEYMFVGYFDPETQVAFEEYMTMCICSSSQNLETFNRLVDAMEATLKTTNYKDANSVQMDECIVTRLRSAV